MDVFASNFSLPPDGCQRHGHQYVQTSDDRNALPLLVDVEDAARLLSLSSRTIWRLAESGKLPPLHIGRATRWPTADLVAFIDGLREQAA